MSNFAFLAAEFPAVHEAAVEAERQAAVSPTAAAFFAGKAVEVRLRAKADAGRGRNSRAAGISGEGESQRIRDLVRQHGCQACWANGQTRDTYQTDPPISL
jgi:hypothetical protein